MEQILIAAIKTNSPAIIVCAGLVGLVYFVINSQREKTASKRDKDKKDQDVRMALQEKDIETLKFQVQNLSSRWDTLQELLNKINENLAAIREKISNLDKRVERIEQDKEN